MGNGYIPGSLIHPRPDPYVRLLDALEDARKAVCCYSPHAPTCDCKYGLLPVPYAVNCKHRSGCEHTGCPEIRDQIKAAKTAQRGFYARISPDHAATRHGWACCEYILLAEPAPRPLRPLCPGPGMCHSCTPEADVTHGLAPGRQLCNICGGHINYQDAPTGGWWAHETHPEDGHDAWPGIDYHQRWMEEQIRATRERRRS